MQPKHNIGNFTGRKDLGRWIFSIKSKDNFLHRNGRQIPYLCITQRGCGISMPGDTQNSTRQDTEQCDLSPALSWVLDQMTFGCPFQSILLYEIMLVSCQVEYCNQGRGEGIFPPLMPFSSSLRLRRVSFLLKEKKGKR